MSMRTEENSPLLEGSQPDESFSLNKRMIIAGVLTMAAIGSIGAYIAPVGSSSAQDSGIVTEQHMRKEMIGSDMPGAIDLASLVNPAAGNIITYNGKQYASISGASPHSNSARCMNGYGANQHFQVPAGWVIAPHDADGINVIASYPWGTHVMGLSNDCMYGVSTYSQGRQFSSCPSQYFKRNGDREFWVSGCHMDFLIMRDGVPPTPVPISNPTPVPISDPTFSPTPIPVADPTVAPTQEPVADPTLEPTAVPTKMDNSCNFEFTKGTSSESVPKGCAMGLDHDINVMKSGTTARAMMVCTSSGADLNIDEDMMDVAKLGGALSYFIVGDEATVSFTAAKGKKMELTSGKHPLTVLQHTNDLVNSFGISSGVGAQSKLPEDVCSAGNEPQEIA